MIERGMLAVCTCVAAKPINALGRSVSLSLCLCMCMTVCGRSWWPERRTRGATQINNLCYLLCTMSSTDRRPLNLIYSVRCQSSTRDASSRLVSSFCVDMMSYVHVREIFERSRSEKVYYSVNNLLPIDWTIVGLRYRLFHFINKQLLYFFYLSNLF